jgi:hypothetical protein
MEDLALPIEPKSTKPVRGFVVKEPQAPDKS